VAYRADIEIAVKGAQELKRLTDQINTASKAVDSLNNYIETFSGANTVRSINTLKQAVSEAAAAFNKAALDTDEATGAAQAYTQATRQLNAGLQERIQLLQTIEQQERKQRLAAAGIRETTQYGGPIGPGAASAVALSSQLRGRTEQILAERRGVTELEAALAELEERRRLETNAILDEKAAQVQLNLERKKEKASFLAGAQQQYRFPVGPSPRSRRVRFENDVSPERAEAALRARELKEQRVLNQQLFRDEKIQIAEIDKRRAEAAAKQTARIQNLSKTIRGSLSSAAIGGAFPLLFGQSPQAAVGGAIGGLLGGQAGGFAGSLIGTALGEIEATKARVKELSAELGLSAQQAQVLGTAFKLAGQNSQQLEAAITNIQGLGLSTAETASAIKIAVELSKEYGGSVEKIAQAFADTLESGKVSIATINKFTAQGIPIQDVLATKIGVSRTKLLEMAKDGKISVQQLTDVLVKLGQNAEQTADKAKNGFDRFTEAVYNVASAIAGAAGAILKNLVPALDTVLSKLADIITRATNALNLIADVQVGEASAALFRSGFTRGVFGGFAQSKAVVDDLTAGLKTLNPELATSRDQLNKISAVAARYDAELKKFGGQTGEYAVKTARVELTKIEKSIQARFKALGAPKAAERITNINALAQLEASGGGRNKDNDKASRDAAREAERVAEVVRNRLAEAEIIKLKSNLQDKIAAAQSADDKLLVTSLQGQQREVELQAKYAQELAKETNTRAQQAIIYAGQVELVANIRETERLLNEEYNRSAKERISALQELIGKQYDLNEQQKQQKELADGIANTFGQGLTSAFDALIQGSNDWGTSLRQIASGVLMDIANQLLQVFVIQKAISAISGLFGGGSGGAFSYAGVQGSALGTSMISGGFSAVPFSTAGLDFGGGFGIMGRATGGPVASRTPYIIGERGPELFVPNSSGTIVPNNQLGGMGGDVSVVVNVDASGSNVQGNESQAKALGGAISAAVQAEIVKQQRPGGLLAGTR